MTGDVCPTPTLGDTLRVLIHSRSRGNFVKFNIGDLVVFQKPHMSSYEWRRDTEPYLTAIVMEKSSHRRENKTEYKFYNVYSASGRKYWDIREDRLAILAKVKD